jgi:hypothetical protein
MIESQILARLTFGVFRTPPGVDPPEINAMHQALRPSALVRLGFAVENVTHNGAITAMQSI